MLDQSLDALDSGARKREHKSREIAFIGSQGEWEVGRECESENVNARVRGWKIKKNPIQKLFAPITLLVTSHPACTPTLTSQNGKPLQFILLLQILFHCTQRTTATRTNIRSADSTHQSTHQEECLWGITSDDLCIRERGISGAGRKE